ncbi:MAG: bifunctional phosphoribosyl-AMP cyclohydrolase/phosphoribosyl-ATP diphosphatase HisIE [Cyclobacteriaceae bacterium]
MEVDFDKNQGLVPVVVQDQMTKNVLMLGYMNEEALQITQQTGNVTFFSRSRQKIWTKGETSGNYLKVTEIQPDCDEDTLLVTAAPAGPVCHTGNATCFSAENAGNETAFLEVLANIVKDRRVNPNQGSYTSALFEEGINKIVQKVGEEAVEVVIEAKDEDEVRFKNEVADLLYHLTVLLEAKSIGWASVIEVLKSRHHNKS